MKDDDGQYWNALKIDARKRTRADALLKTKEGKKSLKRPGSPGTGVQWYRIVHSV